jgi:hypothetical protein
MTIASNTARVLYNTDGVSAVFPVPIQAYQATDFLALLTNETTGVATPLVLNSDYTLVPSGTLTPPQWSLATLSSQFASPYAIGSVLQIILNLPEVQQTQYTQGQAFPSQSMLTNVDRLTQMTIRLTDQAARTLRAPDGDVNPLFVLPNAKLRAAMVQAYDSLGNPTLVPLGGQPFPALQIISPMQYGAVGNGIADDTVAIQNAISANPGAWIIFPGLTFKISSQINITKACKITGVPGHTVIMLATQNQNGFVVGDGTDATRTACFNTLIEGIAFIPSPTVAVCTSGISIFLNFVALVQVRDCQCYGSSDGISKILFEGLRGFQATEFEVTKCTFRLLNGIGTNFFGSNGTTLQTNDGRIDGCEWTSIANDAIYVGAFANGLTFNMPIAYADTHNVMHIDTTGAGRPYNIFILQPDIELDSAAITAISCTDGFGLKQIVGGWIGLGILAASSNAVNVTATSGGLIMEGVNCTQTSVVLSGPACTIQGGEVSGDSATTPTGITINAGATDTQIIGVRVRQWITSGITFVGQPQRCLVDGVIFRNNATDLTGYNYTALGLQPQITGCKTEATNIILPAASIVLHPALPFYQLSGAATTVTTMTPFSLGQRVTFQANDGGGDTFGAGGNIFLKVAPTTITAGKIMSFVCDGVNWFEDGRNF